MNFVKLYIGDYQRDTGHLSIAEHGAYLLMLQHAYATEKPLPTRKALHRLLRAESKTDRDAIDSVVRQFWAESAGGLVNARADEEIRKADHQRTINREVGKRGGRPRKTESVIESAPEPEPNDNPSQTPDTRHQTPDKNKEQRARGTRLQLSALPEDWRAFCAAERADLNPDVVFDRFADYWRAQPGQRGVRLDWLATWRNWVRNERAPVARGAVAPVSKQAALEARNAEHAREFARRIMEQAQHAAATDGQ